MKHLLIYFLISVSFIKQGNAQLYLDRALYAKAETASVEEVEDWLKQGADPNYAGLRGYTSVHKAAEKNTAAVVKALLDAGGNPKAEAQIKTTPLHSAARHCDDPEIIKLLIKAGADVDAELKTLDYTPLYHAARYNKNTNVIKALIDAGANVNAKAVEKARPLHVAIRYNSEENIKLLINAGADIKARTGLLKSDMNGSTPLHYAAAFSSSKIVKYLIDKGAKVNKERKWHYVDIKETPLYYAAERNYEKMMHVLLDAGAEVDLTFQNNEGNLLTRAIEESWDTDLRHRIFNKLIEHKEYQEFLKSTIKGIGYENLDFFSFASSWGDVNTMRILIEKGCSHKSRSMIKVKDELYTGSPLAIASYLGDMDKVQYLVEDLGHDVNERGASKEGFQKGNTPLIMAVISDEKEIADYLIQKGADIEVTDGKNEATPLVWAAFYQKQDMVNYLVEKGANINAIDGKFGLIKEDVLKNVLQNQ